MSNRVDMNVFLHFLLVIKEINDFTVSEAKDVLMIEFSEFPEPVEARKFIYRQLTLSVKKGLLKRTEKKLSGGKTVIYSKTERFFEVSLFPLARGDKAKKVLTKKIQCTLEKPLDYQDELQKELQAYEIDLNTTLEEAKEYQRLLTRFPKLHDQLLQHRSIAKTKSIKLLGKIHAIQNLLGQPLSGLESC